MLRDKAEQQIGGSKNFKGYSGFLDLNNQGCEDRTMGACYNKIEIDSPISDVWNTISDFHDMTWATGIITNISTVGDKKGTEPGAKRVINDVIHETLINRDPDSFTFSYTIDDRSGPVSSFVSNYIVVVKLTSIECGTLVEWSSSFESVNEYAVASFLKPIYSTLLSALKKTLS